MGRCFSKIGEDDGRIRVDLLESRSPISGPVEDDIQPFPANLNRQRDTRQPSPLPIIGNPSKAKINALQSLTPPSPSRNPAPPYDPSSHARSNPAHSAVAPPPI